jgi:hypothetical protein
LETKTIIIELLTGSVAISGVVCYILVSKGKIDPKKVPYNLWMFINSCCYLPFAISQPFWAQRIITVGWCIASLLGTIRATKNSFNRKEKQIC